MAAGLTIFFACGASSGLAVSAAALALVGFSGYKVGRLNFKWTPSSSVTSITYFFASAASATGAFSTLTASLTGALVSNFGSFFKSSADEA